jgi:hypothetical protein
MENKFMIAGFISVCFFLIKFLEMRYVDQESKPLKFLIRDTLIVYVSVFFGIFIIEQLQPVIKDIDDMPIAPLAFTDEPPF